nr:hypothetical protein [Rhodoferax sp.]
MAGKQSKNYPDQTYVRHRTDQLEIALCGIEHACHCVVPVWAASGNLMDLHPSQAPVVIDPSEHPEPAIEIDWLAHG